MSRLVCRCSGLIVLTIVVSRSGFVPLPRRVRAPAREAAVGNQRPWPADKVERWGIERLIPYAKNARVHTDAQVAAIAAMARGGARPRAGRPAGKSANTSPPSRSSLRPRKTANREPVSDPGAFRDPRPACETAGQQGEARPSRGHGKALLRHLQRLRCRGPVRWLAEADPAPQDNRVWPGRSLARVSPCRSWSK